MLSQFKGAIGELAVQKDLLLQGYNVYQPLVDADQVDLVVEMSNGSMKRVQIKSVSHKTKRTAVEVNLSKYKNTNRLTLALTTGKNNQSKGRKWFYSYERFPEFS